MMRHFWVICSLILFTSTANSEDWAAEMFKTKTHDYGTVARGAKSEFVFEFENIYEEDVEVASVRVNCGCVTPTVELGKAKTWEKGRIRARFNTGAFIGDRKATITVVFSKPSYAEVQLQIKGTIRTDVDFSPGVVEFGPIDVDATKSSHRTVRVTRFNDPNWKIVDVLSYNTNYAVTLKEIERNYNRTIYDLEIEMMNTFPVGLVNDNMVIVAEGLKNERFNLAIQGQVLSPLTTSPSNVDFGETAIGSVVTKKIFVRSNGEMTVNDVSSNSNLLEFSVKKINRKVSMISVTVSGELESSILNDEIKVKTTKGIVSIPVSARIK